MRITFILPTVNMSGGIRVISIYAKALEGMGHTVTLVSPPKKKYSFKEQLKSLVRGNGWLIQSKPISHLDSLDLNHHIIEKWRPIVESDVPDADVIIATWWETAEWVINLPDSKGAKVYFIQHHEIHPYLPFERCKATYQLPMHKIVIAKWLKEIMSNDYFDSKTDLVPNSVDHEHFFSPIRAKQNVPTVGFLYSHSSYKGVDITLKVIDKLREQFAELRVITFGSVKPEDPTELDGRIEFHYSPAQDTIRDIYSECDVWITASKTEGFNLPAMEAMACRTPVASTKAGWPDEAITNGLNGVLVNVDDINALANGVATILSLTNDEWKKMSENAHETTKNSTWDSSAKLFEAALNNACMRACHNEISGHCIKGTINE